METPNMGKFFFCRKQWVNCSEPLFHEVNAILEYRPEFTRFTLSQTTNF